MPDKILDSQAALLRPQTGGALVNTDIMSAQAEAGANMGRALQGLGDKGLAIATQIQDKKNAGHMADLRLQMRTHRAEWERDTMPGVPTDERLEAWQTATEEFQGQITQQEMPPSVRAGFEQTYKDYAGNAGLEVQMAAHAEAMANSTQSHVASAEGSLVAGNLPEALDELRAIPGLPEHEYKAMEGDFIKRHDYNTAESAARDGAIDADDERPDTIVEKDWKRLQRTSEISKLRIQGDAMDKLWERQENGSIGTQDHWDKEVDKQVDLTDGQKRKMRDRFKMTTPLDDVEMSDYRDRIANLQKNRESMTADDYEEAYYTLSDDLKAEGDRTKARDLRERVGGMSPDSLKSLEKTRLKSRRDVITEDVMIDFTERLATLREGTEISDPRAKAIRSQADRNFERTLQGENPDDLTPERLDQIKRKSWDDAVKQRSKRGTTDVIFGPSGDDTHPLLPPKPRRRAMPPKTSTLRGG